MSFDVDNTLDISKGPIPSDRVRELKEKGNGTIIVGFNGNHSLARRELGGGFDFYEGGKLATLDKLNREYPDAVLKIHVDDADFKQGCQERGWIYLHPSDFR